MANFRRKIPPALKVSLPLDVDIDSTTPSMAYNQLLAQFSKTDEFLHYKFRSQLDADGKERKDHQVHEVAQIAACPND